MYLLTPPTAEPVTASEAKLAARIAETSAFDAIVPGLIVAARQLAEQVTGRQLMQQTWRIELTDWPASNDVFEIHRATAAAVSYWSTGSAWVTLSGASYEFAAVGNGTGIVPAIGLAWPTLGDKAIGARVRIDLTAGETDPLAVPECVRFYIKAMVAYWIDTPVAASGASLEEVPFLRGSLDPAKLY
jgi:uncharacterized phiE125 gp8 family phage protein